MAHTLGGTIDFAGGRGIFEPSIDPSGGASLEEVVQTLDDTLNQGVVRSARLNLATAPTNNDTVTIDGKVWKFVTTLAAATTFGQIQISTAANNRADLKDGINGVANARVVQPTTAPTTLIVADVIDTSRVRIRDAVSRGGAAVDKAKGFSSIAVSEALTAVADVWDRANLNETGKDPTLAKRVMASIVITTQQITAGKVYIDLPFTPTEFVAFFKSSAGVPLDGVTDAVTIEGNAIKIALAGGGAPALANTNIVTIVASS